ncbi:MAG: hypothetical protein V3S69_07290 [Dehalococcoidales bacterium]
MVGDIDNHFYHIHHWVPEEEHPEFYDRMAACIIDGHAWCTENTFLYYQSEDKHIAYGVALFGQGYAQELLALFAGVFSQQDMITHALKFKLHPGKMMEEYMTLLTPISMKRARRNPNHPVSVRIDALRDKMFKIFKAQGLAKL